MPFTDTVQEVTDFDKELSRIDEEILYWKARGHTRNVEHYNNVRSVYQMCKETGCKVLRVV